MLRVLTLSTLFPDASRPTFGPFVEMQTRRLAVHPQVELRVVAPVGIPLLGQWHPRYSALATLPEVETWNGVTVYRPRFVHVPGVGGRFDAGALTRALAPLLASVREEFAFDVIDAEFFFPDGPAAVELGRIFGVAVSIKARGSDIHLWAKDEDATQAQVVRAGQSADGLLAVSAALKGDMVALGMAEARIGVHYTGVDRTCFYVRDRAMAKAALKIEGRLLVSVGALIERKGHALVIDAIERLPYTQLAIIGGGPERARLEARTKRRGVADRVLFLGNQPHEVVAQWLAAADAMVLMSASEGLANAWVEALACGTPIVIPEVGGAREVLDRPEAGAFATHDAKSVADAITQVFKRDADRNAVAATVARFSWEANTAQLYDHLLKVASTRR